MSVTETSNPSAAPSGGAPLDAERATLLEVLEHHRGFLAYTVQGLTDEQAALRPTVSELCLGGLVKHVTAGWRQWTRFIVEGPDALGGMGSWDPEQEGGGEAFAAAVEAHSNGFRMLPGETLAALLAEFDAAVAWTVEVVSSLPDLDVSHPLPPAPWFQENAVWSARRVLLHLIAETAQHAGHADIIREAIDGQKTMG